MMKFCRETVNKIMTYNLTYVDIQWGGYIIGSTHDVIVESTGEKAGEIKILSKNKIEIDPNDELWRYNFIVEYNVAEQKALVKRLRKLGYM